MMSCRYCEQPIQQDSVAVFTYWRAVKDQAHATCAKSGYAEEALACQTLDADCNDCGYFSRVSMISKEIWIGTCSHLTPNPRSHARLQHGMVRAFPNYASDHPCFVHRKMSRKL